MFKMVIKALGFVKDFADAKEWLGKRWYLSKTLWVNAIALVALFLQSQYGFVIDAEEQVAIVAVINLVLRFVTKQPLVLKEESILKVEVVEEKKDG